MRYFYENFKKVGLYLTLLSVLGSAVAIPPSPPKVTYDYYVYNGISAKVLFAANFHGPFSYSGNGSRQVNDPCVSRGLQNEHLNTE